jgi:hypothetical protein
VHDMVIEMYRNEALLLQKVSDVSLALCDMRGSEMPRIGASGRREDGSFVLVPFAMTPFLFSRLFVFSIPTVHDGASCVCISRKSCMLVSRVIV